MNNCLICGSKKLVKIKKIKNTLIAECPKCNLAITKNKKKSDTDFLYQASNFYKADEYSKTTLTQTKKFSMISRKIKQYLPEGDILEIGAGFGLLSSILANNPKYKITALEPYIKPNYIDKNNKVTYIHSLYEDYLLTTKSKYDALIFIDVLEHFDNPLFILNSSKEIMKKNSLVYINVPNYKSLMARITNNWSWWMVEDHYIHFSKKSLINFLKNNGFTIEYIQSYEPFYDFKKNLDGNFMFIKNKILRKTIKFIFYSTFFSIYFICRKLLWKFGLGGLLFVVARYNKYE